MIRIASVQLNSQNNLNQNLNHIVDSARHANSLGVQLFVLPENACYMGRQADIAKYFDEICGFFGRLAKECEMNIIAGTLPCPFDMEGKPLNNGKFFQTSLAFDSQGEYVARYDKIHLFKATVKDGVGSYDESLTFMAGNTPTLVEFEVGGERVNVGMMICFDLRFPKLAQLYRQLGADILVAPSAFTYATGQANWQMLLQARALDSQCLIVGSAQGGIHRTTNGERKTWGHSMVVGADGTKLHSTEKTTLTGGYELVVAEFHKDKQQEIRQSLPIFDCHRLF